MSDQSSTAYSQPPPLRPLSPPVRRRLRGAASPCGCGAADRRLPAPLPQRLRQPPARAGGPGAVRSAAGRRVPPGVWVGWSAVGGVMGGAWMNCEAGNTHVYKAVAAVDEARAIQAPVGARRLHYLCMTWTPDTRTLLQCVSRAGAVGGTGGDGSCRSGRQRQRWRPATRTCRPNASTHDSCGCSYCRTGAAARLQPVWATAVTCRPGSHRRLPSPGRRAPGGCRRRRRSGRWSRWRRWPYWCGCSAHAHGPAAACSRPIAVHLRGARLPPACRGTASTATAGPAAGGAEQR